MGEAFIQFEHVKKIYRSGEVEVAALRDISFTIEKGELCVIVGESGAGKTTLLNILGGMDSLTEGKILVGGEDISAYDKRRLTAFRRSEVGFVFQFYNLMPNLTALENVELARQVCRSALDPRDVMRQVGLENRMDNFPAQLSGGEQQRVSIARALCKNPALLLCDEPTGALDSQTGVQILSLLQEEQRRGSTVVVITHNASIAEMGTRVIRVKNGRIESVRENPEPRDAEAIAW